MAGADRAECELSLGFLWHHIKESRIVFCLFLKSCFFKKNQISIKPGAHETILVPRPNRYVCGINFYAI